MMKVKEKRKRKARNGEIFWSDRKVNATVMFNTTVRGGSTGMFFFYLQCISVKEIRIYGKMPIQ